ncbi:MAG: homoserine O-acetyltransferase [Holophagales bacterium]|nr:homoserine O-acetyltransferase [Holophagales bacterium]
MTAYAEISPETRFFALPGRFRLESGASLPGVEVAYRTWGRLSAAGDNAVVVCHALTGSADVDRWWPALLGAGRALDPEVDFIVASNALGSCYGTTGPASRRPGSAEPWGADFPRVGVRDQVRLQRLLLDRLGVRRVRLVVGGSLGGMQALEWALLDPRRVDAVASLSAAARHSAWAIAWSEIGRRAIATDPRFRGGRYPSDDPPRAGLEAARAAAMVSYRSHPSFESRFGRDRRADGVYQVASYLAHQGDRLASRFDANAYLALLDAMDGHDLARGRGDLAEVLGGVRQAVWVLSATTDLLYPPVEQEALARGLPKGELATLETPFGHDAFLAEGERVNRLLAGFRARLAAAPDAPAAASAG